MTFGLPCWWNWPEYENIQVDSIPRSSKSKMCLPRLGATSCPGILSWSLFSGSGSLSWSLLWWSGSGCHQLSWDIIMIIVFRIRIIIMRIKIRVAIMTFEMGATSCPGILSGSLLSWSGWGWLWWLWDSEDYNLKEDQGNEDYNLEVTRIIGSGDVDNDIWDGGKFPKGSPSSLQRKIFRVNVFLVIIFERSFFIYFFLEIICSGCFCELGNNCEDVSDRQ